MSAPTKADEATLMRIYKEALAHTLDAAVSAVYERGLHDGTMAATARPDLAQPPATTPAASSRSPAAHLTPPLKASSK